MCQILPQQFIKLLSQIKPVPSYGEPWCQLFI
jgi:hypothetical protein